MAEDEIRHGEPLYAVRMEPDRAPLVQWVPQGESPVKLSVALHEYVNFGANLNDFRPGARLWITMRQDAAVQIYTGIQKLFREMGWKLPDEE